MNILFGWIIIYGVFLIWGSRGIVYVEIVGKDWICRKCYGRLGDLLIREVICCYLDNLGWLGDVFWF